MRTLLLVCLACFSLSGQSAQAPPNQQPSAETSGAEIEKNNRKTQKLQPNPGQTPTGTNSEAQPDQLRTPIPDSHGDQYNSGEKNGTDWPMFALTFFLVVVGALQVLILRRQTHIIDQSLADSQRATRLAHQSLVLTQRPRLIVRNIVISEPDRGERAVHRGTNEPIFAPGDTISGTMSLANSGTGTATIRDSYWRIYNSAEPKRLPMIWPHDATTGGVLAAPGTIIQPGAAIECKLSGDPPSVNQITHAGDPSAGKLQLYVLGRVDYGDELGLVRRMVFCRRYDPAFDNFAPAGNPDYEYAD